MTAEVGRTVTHRRYVPYSHAHYAGNLVDGAYSLAAFGDVATEMCVLTDGDEGLFASYSDVQFLAPVRAGDVIEISATLVRVGTRSREMDFEVRVVGRGAPRARRVRGRRPRPPDRRDDGPGGRRGASSGVTYRGPVPTPLRLPVRLLAAVAGGLCLWLAFPDAGLWWLAPVGVALLGAACLTAGAGRGLLVGLVGGLAFFVPVLSWSGVYVGQAARGSRWRPSRRSTSR